MPYTFSWHEDEPIIFLKFSGDVTGRHINQALEEVRADDRFCPNCHQVWDCQSIARLDVDWPELKALKDMATRQAGYENAPKGRVAIVATREVVYACGKVIIALTQPDGHQKKVVRTVNEAIDWLAVE